MDNKGIKCIQWVDVTRSCCSGTCLHQDSTKARSWSQSAVTCFAVRESCLPWRIGAAQCHIGETTPCGARWRPESLGPQGSCPVVSPGASGTTRSHIPGEPLVLLSQSHQKLEVQEGWTWEYATRAVKSKWGGKWKSNRKKPQNKTQNRQQIH